MPKTMLDLEAIADLMRRNAGHWMMLDEDGYRSALKSKATGWKRRPPKAFASGRFEFRVLKDKYAEPRWARGRFVLWGRFMPVTFGPEDVPQVAETHATIESRMG